MKPNEINPLKESFSEIIEVHKEKEAKHNGAFTAIYCRELQPYLDYNEPLDCPKEQAIPQVLMQLRWDGLFGFPGGKVDDGETLRQAAAREVKEEIGFEVDPAKLTPVCSHMKAGGDFASHLYAYEVDPASFQAAILGSWTARDAIAEVCGVIAPRMSVSGQKQGKGILALINHAPMSFAARHELILLIQRLRLLAEDDMKILNAGLSAHGWW